MILLATGNKILVREKADEIVAKVVEYRKVVNSSGKAVNPIPTPAQAITSSRRVH